MKILFDCGVPFSFAHGGAQIQIEQTKAALESLGVEVDWFKWWKGQQTGEIIHVFGRPALCGVHLAKEARELLRQRQRMSSEYSADLRTCQAGPMKT